jgi:hypothetical protein
LACSAFLDREHLQVRERFRRLVHRIELFESLERELLRCLDVDGKKAFFEERFRLQKDLAQCLRLNSAIEQLALNIMSKIRILPFGIDLICYLNFICAFLGDQQKPILEGEHLLDGRAGLSIENDPAPSRIGMNGRLDFLFWSFMAVGPRPAPSLHAPVIFRLPHDLPNRDFWEDWSKKIEVKYLI